MPCESLLIVIALFGSKYLEHLINSNLIDLKPSSVLDRLYAAGLMHPDRARSRAAAPTQDLQEIMAKAIEVQTAGDTQEIMLLEKWNGKLLAEQFDLPEMEVEIERAVEQVEKSIKSQRETAQEKADSERVQNSRNKKSS